VFDRLVVEAKNLSIPLQKSSVLAKGWVFLGGNCHHPRVCEGIYARERQSNRPCRGIFHDGITPFSRENMAVIGNFQNYFHIFKSLLVIL
jgi:hypothetical protein